MTHYGGLVLAQQLVRRFGVAKRIDEGLKLLKRHAPYHESDHVLALAYTLYADGTCLEDQGALQGSEAVRRLVGAWRIPDPTTAGDFLRRFKSAQEVGQLSGAGDDVQEVVWSKLPAKVRRHRKKHEMALVDLDGHIKPLYGVQKEGADFSYDGRWSYQPLVVTLGGSGECLKVVNQPGSARSSDAAAEAVREVLPRVKRHFKNAIVRGDTDFDRADVYQAVIEQGAYFAIGGRLYGNRAALAERISEKRWQRFYPRAEREASGGPWRQGRTPNYRKNKAQQRGYRTLSTVKQWISEIEYQPSGVPFPCRLIVRRILIEESDGQGVLLKHFRYRLVLSDLPRSYTAQKVVDLTYQRCDQENVIEQFGHGIAGWRMPVAQFMGNSAWLEIARLAWNLGKWIAQLALPAEVVRWEWKRFRRHFVHIAAKVLKLGHSVVVRLAGSHRYLPDILTAHARLQT
ncbi:IS1380 family transposase [Methyloceanibacter sp.]|uniref:IS1380 family transposase n=1 Tax=Methyloceanibacter sp. TaxID=1965321 RepID=UPI003D6D5A49